MIKNLFLLVLLVSFTLLDVYSQQENYWDFGNGIIMTTNGSIDILEYKLDSANNLYSYGFVARVGGVAFGETLQDPGESVNIEYHPENEDGKRLMINYNGEAIQPSIFDWQLIPIAKYANNEFNACVSLFGEETDDKKYHILFHEAFRNTLLGMRLLQADIMLIDLAQFWRLPLYNGEYVLGLGEELHDSISWRRAAMEIQDIIYSESFQSWVLTDNDNEIAFKPGKEALFTGHPYYHFWISDQDRYRQKFDSLAAIAEDYRAKNLVTEYNRVVLEANKLEPGVQCVEKITNNLKSRPYLISLYNPAVYQAACNTMHYAALFRKIKSDSPEIWRSFTESIDTVTISPEVKTPVYWRK